MQILSTPISVSNVRESMTFRDFKEIGVEEHDGDVRFYTGSGNTAVSSMLNKKYAIQPLFMVKSQKLPRL